MARTGLALWVAGTVVATTYTLAVAAIDASTIAVVIAAAVCTLITLVTPWQRISRYWMLPMVALAVGEISWAFAELNEPSILSFHLFAMIFVTAFFWRDRAVVAGGLCLSAAAFAGAVATGAGGFGELAVTLPAYLIIALAVGVLVDRFSDLRDGERERFRATIEALATALDARDSYTGTHSAETVKLVGAVCDELGLPRESTDFTTDVALLHDIGKIGIPNEVLHAPAGLTRPQRMLMRTHAEIGERIVSRVPGLEQVARAIRHEHERWDGEGYPDRLSREEIPLASRIVFACDAYHAMVSDRPYRAAMRFENARDELERNAGSQFDPRVVGALLAVLDTSENVESQLARMRSSHARSDQAITA